MRGRVTCSKYTTRCCSADSAASCNDCPRSLSVSGKRLFQAAAPHPSPTAPPWPGTARRPRIHFLRARRPAQPLPGGALDSLCSTASDHAADSAIIYRVGTLPAAFVIDVEGLVRRIQRGSGQKDMEQAEATASAVIKAEFDAERTRIGTEGGTTQTVRLNAGKLNAGMLPRASEPGRGISAP